MAEPFVYCLNTSTIMKSKLTPMERFRLVAEAGYSAIEPWVRELDDHVAMGGKLGDLRKLCSDRGLKVAGLIGFFEWAVNDDARRAKGFEECRRNMAQVAELGGTQLEAPPLGIHEPGSEALDLKRVAERYYALCELGERMGVTPLCEFWGASCRLSTLAEAVAVVVGSGHPRGAVLADIFHMYRGGSDWRGLGKLGAGAIGLVHVNDYPATPAREVIGDSDRVWPGHGVGRVTEVLRLLRDVGYRGALSVELFNETYYAMDPLEAAKAGLAAIKACVAAM